MLRYLRENTGNWIIKIFLGIIVIVFVFLGVGSMNASKQNEVAVVNDQVITFNEFQDAYRNMIAQMRQQFGDSLNEELIKALNIKAQTINNLIDQRILDMEAEKLNIMVTDQELQDRVLSIKAFQKDGSFDIELYKKILARNRMTPESFEMIQRQAIKNGKLRQMVISGVTVSDDEALAWYRFNNTKTAIEYVKIDPASFTAVNPTLEQLKAEYNENLNNYKSQPQRKAAYLVFSPQDHEGSISISDTQAREFYALNKARFTTPEQVEASHILIRLAADADEDAVAAAKKSANKVYEKATKGENFAELAKAYSQGPTAPKGGYLGKFERRSMVKPFADAAFAMKPGDISKPVRTQFGFHIIQLISKTPENTKKFDAVKPVIKKELASQELQNMAYYKAGEAFDAVIDGDDFEQVALIAKKKVMTTPGFTSDGNGLAGESAIGNGVEFAREAFALEGDTTSEVKQIGDKYYLIKIIEKIEPEQLAFEDVQADIQLALKETLQKEAARNAAQKLLKKIEGKTDIANAAESEGLSVSTSEGFTRNQGVPGIQGSNAIASAAFTLDKANSVCREVLEANGDFYVIGLKSREIPSDADTQKALDKVKAEMGNMKQREYYTAWIQSLKDDAEITINTEVIN
ncbi:MAG: parvulin peptidyl-prolyl isomerase [Desulfobacterales bacterium]|nr:MAG: parvulin peptidyl-prolyl isomerase [Desulfobacterales bacterium]